MPAELGSMSLGNSMPPRAATKAVMQDKANEIDYKFSRMGSCRLRIDAALISFLLAFPCKFKILVVSLPQNEAKKPK
jgi:hypothetical protein